MRSSGRRSTGKTRCPSAIGAEVLRPVHIALAAFCLCAGSAASWCQAAPDVGKAKQDGSVSGLRRRPQGRCAGERASRRRPSMRPFAASAVPIRPCSHGSRGRASSGVRSGTISSARSRPHGSPEAGHAVPRLALTVSAIEARYGVPSLRAPGHLGHRIGFRRERRLGADDPRAGDAGRRPAPGNPVPGRTARRARDSATGRHRAGPDARELGRGHGSGAVPAFDLPGARGRLRRGRPPRHLDQRRRRARLHRRLPQGPRVEPRRCPGATPSACPTASI